jgi:DUF1365 family protein
VRSRILIGETGHARLEPVRHDFRYPLFYLAFELHELSACQRGRLLAVNRRGLFSLRESDYLGPRSGTIVEKLRALLEANGFEWRDEEAFLITMPRVLGYIFNPVSFYLVFNQQRELTAMVCEVNNTFGEKHLYTHIPATPVALPYAFELTKEFYVSPFFDTNGTYEITVRSFDERLDIGIVLKRDTPVFWAGLSGEWRPFTTAGLWSVVVQFPFTAFLTMNRIHLHAVKLRLKSLIPWMKPAPLSPRTVRSEQRLIHRVRLGIIRFWRWRSSRTARAK